MRPQSLVYDVNRGVRRWATYVHDCTREWSSPEVNLGIVGKAEAFFGKAEDVPVEFHVFVFVVKNNDAIISRRKILHHNRCAEARSSHGRVLVAEGFAHILGLSDSGSERQRRPRLCDCEAHRRKCAGCRPAV
jgi:hypothetical protein